MADDSAILVPRPSAELSTDRHDPGASLAHAQHYLETGVDNGYWNEKPGAPRSQP